MKPFDPRLLTYARPVRGYLILTASTGIGITALIVAQAFLLAHILAPVISRQSDLPQVLHLVWWLAGVVALRAVATWVQERFAQRAATRTIADLRQQVAVHVSEMDPRWISDGRAPKITALLSSGLRDLEPYFMRYLPQLVLTAIVTPVTLALVLWQDWIAGVIAAFTIPLIPVFMWLIGQLTQTVAQRRLQQMQMLAAQVLDLLTGLPTLRALGRHVGPAKRVRALGAEHRKATMGTLRLAFLSSMVLELLTTLSVALIAVSVGFRLVYGDVDFTVALAVLILAPEIYQPLRQVGAQFHASADGMSAANQAFEVLAEPRLTATGNQPLPISRQAAISIRVQNLSVATPQGNLLAPHALSFTAHPGQITALTGPNGSGKTTGLLAVLGLVPAASGEVIVASADGQWALQDSLVQDWWQVVSWVPQRPILEPGTVWDLVCAEAADLPDADLRPLAQAAAAQTGLDQVISTLPQGWHTKLGHGGLGLSVGQAHRLMLTRALIARRPVLLLDEPTAHLDAMTGQQITQVLLAERARGVTVMICAHRGDLLDLADQVVEVSRENVPVPEGTK